ncbi:DUF4124 domain-containing protein [Aquabacterium sp.]|uniref:DUF4124 domain-containing protein n=1 Tax=Aquabacterium TaxID=92793 RepID=UPI001D37CA24|nr:DUF4124 domain-containing protein [Aquabacterium sp.]MBT9611541.1 DUF4124 domain-containing protein [Aquabacterium sp.]
MKIPTPAASGLACAGLLVLALAASPAQAGMQWKWRDANGATQYSDRPPPPGTPDSAILARPSPSSRQVRVVESVPSASAAATGNAAVPAAPKTADPELEARRKKSEEERIARQKADEEKQAKVRADNCERARGYERSLKDGMRIARTNEKGEREILDDKARSEELQRTQETIQSNCGK